MLNVYIFVYNEKLYESIYIDLYNIMTKDITII